MINFIEQEFMYLIENRGYSKSIEDLTFVVKNIVYSKENIRIVFTCELAENAFDFEIWFTLNGKEYSICEWAGRRQLHYQNRGNVNIIQQSIFEYTIGMWDEASFQKQKEVLLHKKFGFNRSQKLLRESIVLYKKLLMPVISNIEKQVNLRGNCK